MPMFPRDERIGLFIDGANIHMTAKMLNVEFDYKLLVEEFGRRGNIITANYYTAVFENKDGVVGIAKLIDWLSYNNMQMVMKDAKEFTDHRGDTKVKGNMDIEMAVDCFELCDALDHYYLFTGDGDFHYLIKALRRKGKKVTVVSTKGMVADELRRATTYLDISTLVDKIKRVREAA